MKVSNQSSLGNEVERALITATLISSYLLPFCLRKKRPENAFLTLIVNYCKIVHKNKLYQPKQQ